MSIDQQQVELFSPAERPARKPRKATGPADAVAQAVYEATERMVNFMAVRGIASRALAMDGVTPEQVTAAMVQLHTAGRPITLQTTGQTLRGYSGSRQTAATSERQNRWAAWDATAAQVDAWRLAQ